MRETVICRYMSFIEEVSISSIRFAKVVISEFAFPVYDPLDGDVPVGRVRHLILAGGAAARGGQLWGMHI